jgi:ornithine decarboxylase/arginine decarboxylase
MDYFRRFNFLFAAPSFDADDLEGMRFNQIVEEIQRSGFEVVKARRIEAAILILAGSAAFLRVRLIESGWMWTVSNW